MAKQSGLLNFLLLRRFGTLRQAQRTSPCRVESFVVSLGCSAYTEEVSLKLYSTGQSGCKPAATGFSFRQPTCRRQLLHSNAKCWAQSYQSHHGHQGINLIKDIYSITSDIAGRAVVNALRTILSPIIFWKVLNDLFAQSHKSLACHSRRDIHTPHVCAIR